TSLERRLRHDEQRWQLAREFFEPVKDLSARGQRHCRLERRADNFVFARRVERFENLLPHLHEPVPFARLLALLWRDAGDQFAGIREKIYMYTAGRAAGVLRMR